MDFEGKNTCFRACASSLMLSYNFLGESKDGKSYRNVSPEEPKIV